MGNGNGKPAYMRLLDPQALAKIHRLELHGSRRGGGVCLPGGTRARTRAFPWSSPSTGSTCPATTRATWTGGCYGKSDRYYIKQYIEETNLRVDHPAGRLRLDELHRHPGRQARRPGPSASSSTASSWPPAMAHLMIHQQDAVGLVTFDTQVRRYIPARSRVSHLAGHPAGTPRRPQPGDETALAPILHDIAERAHRRGPDHHHLRPLRRPRGDPQGPAPLPLPQARGARAARDGRGGTDFPFDAMERVPRPGGRRPPRPVDPRAVRASTSTRSAASCARIEMGCGQMGVDYVPLNTRSDFDVALSHYLAQRRSRTK